MVGGGGGGGGGHAQTITLGACARVNNDGGPQDSPASFCWAQRLVVSIIIM